LLIGAILSLGAAAAARHILRLLQRRKETDVPGQDDLLARFGGGAALKEAFRVRGYVVLESLFSAADLAEINREIVQPLLKQGKEPSTNEGDWNTAGSFVYESDSERDPDQKARPGHTPSARLLKVQGVALKDPRVVTKVFQQAALMQAVHWLLLGKKPPSLSTANSASIDAFGTKLFPVWPQGGRSVGWHTDTYYFGSRSQAGGQELRRAPTPETPLPPNLILSCAVYLNATDRENGCFRILPGTQKLPEDPEHARKTNEGEWIEEEELQRLGLLNSESTLPLDISVPAGSAVIFDARVIHGAHPNRSADRPRHSLFAHFARGDHAFNWRGVDFAFGKYPDRHRLVQGGDG